MKFEDGSSWTSSRWGREAAFKYGKALPPDAAEEGPVQVWGTNGPTRTTNARLGTGPTAVVGRKGAYREVHLAEGPFWVIDTAFFTVFGPNVDPIWGYYELKSRDVNALDSGSAIPSTRRQDLEAMNVLLPDLDEQRRIAGVLVALDKKLVANRKLVENLERSLQNAFRRLIDQEDWPKEAIDELLTLKGGGTPSTKEESFWGGNFHWVTPKDLSQRPLTPLLETSRTLTGDGVQKISSGLLPLNTVLMSSRAPIGFTAITKIETAINQGFIAVPPNGVIPSSFVLCWMRGNLNQIKAYAGGSTFAEISKKNFKAIKIERPPDAALNDFDELATPIIDLITSLERESMTLGEIRDALLPKLISGQVRVPETYDPSGVLDELLEDTKAELITGAEQEAETVGAGS